MSGTDDVVISRAEEKDFSAAADCLFQSFFYHEPLTSLCKVQSDHYRQFVEDGLHESMRKGIVLVAKTQKNLIGVRTMGKSAQGSIPVESSLTTLVDCLKEIEIEHAKRSHDEFSLHALMLAINPEFHGYGVGKMLWHAALREALRKGWKEVYGEVTGARSRSLAAKTAGRNYLDDLELKIGHNVSIYSFRL